MSYIESLIQSLVMILATLSPIEGFSPEQQLESGVFPHVYIVPQEELAMVACGCPCAATGAYLGRQYVGGIESHIIVMGGIEKDFVFLEEEASVVFTNTPYWHAVLYHELDHHRQFLSTDFETLAKQYEHDREVAMFVRLLMEEEAYVHHNDYHMIVGLPPLQIKGKVSDSLSYASGEKTCPPGVIPIPPEERFNILDLIEFYDEGMIKIYTDKYH